MIEQRPFILVHGRDAHASKPIDSQPELTRQRSIAATTDMAAEADRVARASRQGEAEPPIELAVQIPDAGAALSIIDAILRIEPNLVQ